MKLTFMPIGFPNWNAARPLDSFKAFTASIRAQAQQMMITDGTHATMVFFVPLNGRGVALPWVGGDSDMLAELMRRYIRENYIYGVVHVVEAWMRLAEIGPNDHTLKQVIDGEIKVSELKPEDRREALSVTAQSRDGYAHTWIDEILRIGGTDTIRLGACHEFDEFQGRFGELFG